MVRAFLMYRARSDERGPTMDGDLDGKAAQGAAGEGHEGEQALQEGHQDAQADGAQEVTGGGTDGGAADYRAALRAKDAQITELQGKVASAAKTAEATEALNAEIAQLKQQMADERVEFALRSAGARSVKAAKALLEEHDGDVAALVAAEPWLFEGAAALHKGLHKHLRATQHVRRPSSPICCCMRFSTSFPRVSPIRSMRPASLRDALALSSCRSLLPIAVAISFAVAIGFAWIASKNSSLGHRQRLCPNDLADTITDICSASWTADLVARLVPLAAPWWLNLCHERGGLPSHTRQAEAGQAARLKFQRQTHPVRLPKLLEQGIGLAGTVRTLAQRVVAAACPLPNVEQTEHGEERPVARVGHAARPHLAYRDPKRAWVGRDDAVRLPHPTFADQD